MTARAHTLASFVLTFASVAWALAGFFVLMWPKPPLTFVLVCAGMTVACAGLSHRHYLRAEEIVRKDELSRAYWRAKG